MIKIEYIANFFRKVKKLSKKNKHLAKDMQELVKVLEKEVVLGLSRIMLTKII